MSQDFIKHIEKMLALGQKIIKSSPILGDEVGTINAKGDHTIAMDVKVEKALIDYIKTNNIPANIFSEEIGLVKFHPSPTHLIVFDPLDGSTNYRIGKNILPYGLMICCFKGVKPRLGDVIASGAREYTTNQAWIFNGLRTKKIGGGDIKLNKKWKIEASTPVYLDTYYKEGYKTYLPLAGKIFIRNNGSSIGNLSYVLAEVAACLGGVCMRPEEIGTVVSLIKGAGGVTLDHQGKDIGHAPFSPDKTYPILAGDKNIIDFAVSQIKGKS
jgi:fructose-1,6-bisphosphatase/inositol monophosphatase family enzyme